jgi:cytochrome c oxidase assembly protein subunit 15
MNEHGALAKGPDCSRAVAAWLVVVAFLVLAMVVVGGATRVTGSGLSITQWKPVTGAIPPLSSEAWNNAFSLYRQTPQYRLQNTGISLGQFQSIYWWEWTHRLLGRIVGLAFLGPFLVLLAARRIPRRLVWRCVVLFVLGGLQGAVGWWMVQSGLEARTSVAPERLAVHLGLALVLFSASIWTALEAWFGPSPQSSRSSGWAWASGSFLAAVFGQCLLGALVAGNHAGLANADWPLMAGRWFPMDYWQGSLWSTLAHGMAAVQFNHRLVAYGLLASGLAMAALAWRTPMRPLALLVVGLLVSQAVLGVVLLITTVPLGLAMLHQFIAASLLAAATALAWRAQRYSVL